MMTAGQGKEIKMETTTKLGTKMIEMDRKRKLTMVEAVEQCGQNDGHRRSGGPTNDKKQQDREKDDGGKNERVKHSRSEQLD